MHVRTLYIALAVSVLTGLAQTASAQKEIAMQTGKGNLTLIFSGFSQDRYGMSSLQASIRNDTAFKFRNVMFAMYGYDANGHELWLCGTPGISADGGCGFELFDSIEPGQTLKIRSPGDSVLVNAARNVAKTEFKIKEAPYFIKYDVQVDPVANEKFTISPSFGVKGIGLEFRNKSSDVIEVAWDQSVYIDEEGNSSRLIKGGVNLAEKDRPQPNTVIPPGSKLQETVFPVSAS